MLTEARLIVPGAQALLGFQLAVTFTRPFGELADGPKEIHVAALCAVTLAVVLLMTPAALHRIAFLGQDSDRFLALASRFVLAAPFSLALGLAADMQVAIAKATDATAAATFLAIASFVALIGLWYALPLLLRMRRCRTHPRRGAVVDRHVDRPGV